MLFLRSTALALLFASPAVAHNEWANGGKIPDWVKSSCCGPADAHHLRPDQVMDMGDYYVIDGYHDRIPKRLADGKPNSSILPSQDGDYWVFYSDEPAHWAGSQYGGHAYYENSRQSGVYCFFVPMAF